MYTTLEGEEGLSSLGLLRKRPKPKTDVSAEFLSGPYSISKSHETSNLVQCHTYSATIYVLVCVERLGVIERGLGVSERSRGTEATKEAKWVNVGIADLLFPTNLNPSYLSKTAL